MLIKAHVPSLFTICAAATNAATIMYQYIPVYIYDYVVLLETEEYCIKNGSHTIRNVLDLGVEDYFWLKYKPSHAATVISELSLSCYYSRYIAAELLHRVVLEDEPLQTMCDVMMLAARTNNYGFFYMHYDEIKTAYSLSEMLQQAIITDSDDISYCILYKADITAANIVDVCRHGSRIITSVVLFMKLVYEARLNL